MSEKPEPYIWHGYVILTPIGVMIHSSMSTSRPTSWRSLSQHGETRLSLKKRGFRCAEIWIKEAEKRTNHD